MSYAIAARVLLTEDFLDRPGRTVQRDRVYEITDVYPSKHGTTYTIAPTEETGGPDHELALYGTEPHEIRPELTYYVVRDPWRGEPRAYTVASFLDTDRGDLPSGEYGVDWVVVKAKSELEARARWHNRSLHIYEDVAVDLFGVEVAL